MHNYRSLRLLWVVLCSSLMSAALSSQAWSGWEKRNFEKITIPGATCGNGQPYSVYFDKRDPYKLAFAFQGGGACWDRLSCFGKLKVTALGPHGPSSGEAFTSGDPRKSVLSDYSMIHFPYCTGDVFLGTSNVYYGKGKRVLHVGRLNIEKAMAYLASIGIIEFPKVENVAIYGFSAGALGALYHLNTIAPYFENAREKVLLSDGPGLHFGKVAFKKFKAQLRDDFAYAMGKMGVRFSTKSGNVAGIVPGLCSRYPDWRIGVLQSSQDVVMAFFGEISLYAMRKLAYGRTGVYAITKDPNDNCSAWLPDVAMHTFLVKDWSLRTTWADRVNAFDYAYDVIHGKSMRSYNGSKRHY